MKDLTDNINANKDVTIDGVRARKCTYPGVTKDQYLITEDGRVYSYISNIFLKPRIHKNHGKDSQAYESISLSGLKHIAIYRLVAWEFCQKPEGCNSVDHLDRDHFNNHYTNLEWVTPAENTRRASQMGAYPGISYDLDFVREICEHLQSGKSVREIFSLYENGNVPFSKNDSLVRLIQDLRHRRRWDNITKEYTYTLDSTKRKKGERYTSFESDSVYDEELAKYICEQLELGLLPIEIFHKFHPDEKAKGPYHNLYCFILNLRNRRNWHNLTDKYSYEYETQKHVSLLNDDYYQLFCDGLSFEEAKRMVRENVNDTNKEKTMRRLYRIYSKYRQIHEISDKEDIIIKEN